MARKPKTQPGPNVAAASPVPEPIAPSARRGHRLKAAATSPASLAAASIDDPATGGVGADAAKAAPVKASSRSGPGRKLKQRVGAEAATLSQDTTGEQAGAEGNASAVGLEQVAVEDNAPVAERADPLDDAGTDGTAPGDTPADKAASGAASSATGPGSAARAAPAARWDQATDTAEFDWPEIERMAAYDGPNQAMAKLLVAARAEGASSRWPL